MYGPPLGLTLDQNSLSGPEVPIREIEPGLLAMTFGLPTSSRDAGNENRRSLFAAALGGRDHRGAVDRVRVAWIVWRVRLARRRGVRSRAGFAWIERATTFLPIVRAAVEQEHFAWAGPPFCA